MENSVIDPPTIRGERIIVQKMFFEKSKKMIFHIYGDRIGQGSREMFSYLQRYQ